MRLVGLAFFAVVLACQTWSAEPMMAPNGRQGTYIQCKDSVDCYGLAAQFCPQGYDIADSRSENQGAYVAGNVAVAVNRHEMLITCLRSEKVRATWEIEPARPATTK